VAQLLTDKNLQPGENSGQSCKAIALGDGRALCGSAGLSVVFCVGFRVEPVVERRLKREINQPPSKGVYYGVEFVLAFVLLARCPMLRLGSFK
jgi:hypothetical protein